MTDSIKAWIERRRTARTAGDVVDQIADSKRNFPRALDAIERVLGLHVKGYETAGIHWCSECETKWPCATVQAIEGAIGD